MRYEALMQRLAQMPGEPQPVGGLVLSRREFLKLSAGAAFALGLYTVPAAAAEAGQASKPSEMPDAFIAVHGDGGIVIQVNRLEFGQGVYTALPMLLAEEFDGDWALVRPHLAPAGDAYKDPFMGMQMTGGSMSVKNSWLQYRELGARARAMFVAAAARRWGASPAACRTRNSVVLGPGGRHASYGELAAAAMAEAVPEQVTLKAARDFVLIGKPTRRLDSPAKVNGREQYGLDVHLPGMKTVLLAKPPVFGGKLGRWDAAAARKVPGVVDVFPVPLDRGAGGLAVVAEGFWPAHQGRRALQVQWDTAGLEKVDSARQLAHYRELAGTPGLVARDDDISALDKAMHRLRAEYEFPYLAHAPMEVLNCTLHYHGDRCDIWVGTQFQTMDQMAAAKVLGLKPEQVAIHTQMAGGGFGRRAVPTSDYVAEAAAVAKSWRAAGHGEPIKVMWTREDDLHGGYYRPAYLHRVDIGFNGSGRIMGWKHMVVGQSIAAGTAMAPFLMKNGIDHLVVEGIVDTPYRLPMRLEVHQPEVNVPVLWWRSVGNTHTAYVMETLIDELAQQSGQDPVAYRKELMQNRHPRHVAALDLAVARSGYGRRKLPKDHAWGVAVHEAFGSVVAYVVEAALDNGRPRLLKATAGVHCNLAVNPLTVRAQVEGAALMALSTTLPDNAITFEDGVVQQDNFNTYQIARMDAMPEVDVHIVPSADPPTGMGEPGLPPLAPAYANAIARLTGKRLRRLPFDLA